MSEPDPASTNQESIPFESAHAAADGSMALPNPTPGIIEARDAALAPPTGDPPPPAAAGEAGFDPARHEVDPATGQPRLTKAGKLKLKRGNGSRVAAGKPLAGVTQGKLVLPPSETAQAPQATGNGQGTTATGMPAGQVQSVTVGDPVAPTPPPITLQECETTAIGVAHATWAIFRMIGGPKWENDKAELDSWAAAWKRVWFHYQLPLIGPLIEVFILAIRAAAKRSEGSGARKWLAGAWRWCRGGDFNEPEPAKAAA